MRTRRSALSTPDSPLPDSDRWADAIASATAHVSPEDSERDEDRDADGPQQGRTILLLAVGALMTVAVALGVRGVTDAEPTTLLPATQAADLRMEASALVEQIEAYRNERGELPDPSVLRPYLEEGYAYDVVNAEEGRYVVRRTAGGVTVAYDGSLPLGLWLVVGGGSQGGSP